MPHQRNDMFNLLPKTQDGMQIRQLDSDERAGLRRLELDEALKKGFYV
jgi:hypothetical protein